MCDSDEKNDKLHFFFRFFFLICKQVNVLGEPMLCIQLHTDRSKHRLDPTALQFVWQFDFVRDTTQQSQQSPTTQHTSIIIININIINIINIIINTLLCTRCRSQRWLPLVSVPRASRWRWRVLWCTHRCACRSAPATLFSPRSEWFPASTVIIRNQFNICIYS